MSLMRCRSCLAKFAVGLLRCPQCQKVSELFAWPEHEAEQEENMPKITVGGGASNAALDEQAVAEETTAPVAAPDAVAEPAAPAAETPAEPEESASVPTPAPKARKKAAAPPA
jgi:hypothetical protein